MKRPLLAAALFAAILGSAVLAQAQSRARGFALDRFEPSDRGSRWFHAESLDQRSALGLVFDYANQPLVVYAPDGERTIAVVEHQFFVHAGGTLVVGDRVRLALSVPMALFQDGDVARVSTMIFESEHAKTLGDIRGGGDVRLAGRYGGPLVFTAGMQVFAPTGSRQSYTGDGSPHLRPRVNLAGDWGKAFAFAVQLGFRLRVWSDDLGFHIGPKDDDFAGSNMGGDTSCTAALGVKLAGGSITVGPEISFATMAGDFLGERTTPIEGLLGTHFTLGAFRFGVGSGPGIGHSFGTPALRAVLSAEYVEPFEQKPREDPDRDRDGIADRRDACRDKPGIVTNDAKTNGCPEPAPTADRDADGVTDEQDACPDKVGVPSNDATTRGCPAPKDRDGDGVVDEQDACPDQAGVRTDQPKTSGCPPPKDRDGDGVSDEQDACPDQAGVSTDVPKTTGCPAGSDRDEDGIVDAKDACPNYRGPKLFNHPEKTGCPIARIEGNEIKLRERIEFARGSALILAYSQFVLKDVLKVLQQDLKIRLLAVEAHTDSDGLPDYNKRLSQSRADAIVRWLVQRGVDPARLTATGVGAERPVDKNDTATGRLNNRRVEFHILERAQ